MSIYIWTIQSVLKKHTSTNSLRNSVHKGRTRPPALDEIQTLQGQRKSSERVCALTGGSMAGYQPFRLILGARQHEAGVIRATGQGRGFEHPHSCCDSIKQPVQLRGRQKKKSSKFSGHHWLNVLNANASWRPAFFWAVRPNAECIFLEEKIGRGSRFDEPSSLPALASSKCDSFHTNAFSLLLRKASYVLFFRVRIFCTKGINKRTFGAFSFLRGRNIWIFMCSLGHVLFLMFSPISTQKQTHRMCKIQLWNTTALLPC